MNRWLWIFAAPMAACSGEEGKPDSAHTGEEPEACELVDAFVDADFDGFGDPDKPTRSCLIPGVASQGEDCDDTDADIHPDSGEPCDGRDNDCDEQVDETSDLVESFADADGDGYGDPSTGESFCEVPAGRTSELGDCDDHDAAVYEGAVETCNGRDDDCDEQVDEQLQIAMFVDGDGDGYGNPEARHDACPGTPGLAEAPGDCDDGDPQVFPLSPEDCDGIDDDCDGTVDDGVAVQLYPDADGDGFGDAAYPSMGCDRAGFVADGTDCDDREPASWPGAAEVCDQLDNDCDRAIDEELSGWWFADSDGDGHGNPFTGVETCEPLLGWVADDTDCDDTDAAAPPTCPTHLPMDWTTFGGGPRRDHYAMGHVASAQAELLWEVTVEEMGVQPVAVGQGRVYASLTGYFTEQSVVAWDLDDGTELWTYDLSEQFGMSGPGLADDLVCFTACYSSDSEITCLDPATGVVQWVSPIAMQWEVYLPPVAHDGVLYSGGGTYGGMYGHRLTDGDELFFESLDQVDAWGAAIHDGVVYTWIDETLRAHEPRTGNVVWSQALGTEWFLDEAVPAISRDGVAVLVGYSKVWAVDLRARTTLWQQSVTVSAPPAIAGEDVYLVKSDGTVQRRDLRTGAVTGTVAGDSELQAVVVTDDVLVASSSESTFVVDRVTHDVVQEIDAGGEPVIADNHLVLVDRLTSRVQVWRW